MIQEKCISCEKSLFFSCPADKKRRYKTGKCVKCYRITLSINKGENATNWKGGITMRNGYRFVRATNHPFANNIGYVREHRLVMEKHLGRFLNPKEIVHHINHDRTDNRIENLELCSNQSEHVKNEHGKDRQRTCTLCDKKHLARGYCSTHYWILFLKNHRSSNS